MKKKGLTFLFDIHTVVYIHTYIELMGIILLQLFVH
jgi:hypothetical protein